MALACILCFLPFSLGRIILWSRSCLNVGNVDEINCYTATASTLLIGYGFIFKVGATLAGLHTFYLYLRGKRLVIAIFCRSLHAIFFRHTPIVLQYYTYYFSSASCSAELVYGNTYTSDDQIQTIMCYCCPCPRTEPR